MSNLLPPNATPLERGLAEVTARIADVPLPMAELLDPYACPIGILPWLAWENSVDSWDPDWPEATKRAAVANAIAEHRVKGTRFAVEQVLERFDEFLQIVEWHEANPRLEPNTFEVTLPLVLEDGTAPGGRRATAAFAEQLIREIGGAKPLREHFVLLQQIRGEVSVGIQGVSRAFGLARNDLTITVDDSQPWADLLQDENGEPLQDDPGNFLDETP